jgi:hypothetical protein
VNRQQRRAAQRKQLRVSNNDDPLVCPDRASTLRILSALIEADPTVSGATIISQDGEISYIDDAAMRSGGAA